MSTYRVQVLHEDPEHHHHAPAFHGPAFDSGYQTLLEQAGQGPVDLLEQASACAERVRAEHPASDGWVVQVVTLVDHGETSSWEEVV
jgi:hypothetical protein